MPLFDMIFSWVWVFLVLAVPFVLAGCVRVVRFAVKRVGLLLFLRQCGAESLRPLAWLIPWRRACDYLIPLRDPKTGQVTRTLAVQIIPTILGGTEYCVGDLVHWKRQRNVLIYRIRFNTGYHRCRPRDPERVFRRVPYTAVRVYLFHPHPYVLSLGLRGQGRVMNAAAEDVLAVPFWQGDVLFLDLACLRRMVAGDEEAWR